MVAGEATGAAVFVDFGGGGGIWWEEEAEVGGLPTDDASGRKSGTLSKPMEAGGPAGDA